MELNMFEKAAKMRLRFETRKGNYAVDDLFSLPLKSAVGAVSLQELAAGISKKLKNSEEENFVDDSPSEDPILRLQLDILKRVIEIKKAENKEQEERSTKKAKKQRILELMKRKENEADEQKTLEELQAELDKL